MLGLTVLINSRKLSLPNHFTSVSQMLVNNRGQPS